MWKVIKMNKKFCKSTGMVLAEVCKALKTNPRVYFSGKKILLILMGNWWHCILGNIIKSDTWLSSQATAVTTESICKFSKETKQIKLAREILMSMKVYFCIAFFCHCWKSLLREWKVNASVEGNIWKRHFWKRNQIQNILKAHKSRRRENS